VVNEAADRLSEAVQGQLADAVHGIDGSMLTKYAACIEVLDPTGERALWVICTPGQKAWETVGLLEYARDLERAAEPQE
jgi:hypothetical protein